MRRTGWILLCALALPGLAGAQLAPRLLRGPYLQAGTQTSVVVRWRTDVPSDSLVRYGSSPDALDRAAGDPLPVTDHQVTLSGLSPGTRYYYSVGSAGQTLSTGIENTFTTAPPPGTQRPIRLWAFGDAGVDNAGQLRVLDAYLGFAGERRADVWLILGDLAYTLATDEDFQQDFFAIYPGLLRQSVAWTAVGNHEGFTANSETALGLYYDIFTLPAAGEAGGAPSGTEAYYSFDYGDIHFIVLNTELRDLSRTSPMLAWLRQDLAANTRQWTIAAFHRPPYTRGSHDSDELLDGDGSTAFQQIRQNILPLLEESGVDLVLGAHSHSYERSFLLDGHYGPSSTFDPAMKLDPGDGSPAGTGAYLKTDDLTADAHGGTVYAVVGTGGENAGGGFGHPAMHTAIGDAAGTLVVDIAGKRLDAFFLDEHGTARDRFSIIKGVNVPPDARDDRTLTERGVPVAIPVLANDRDRNRDPLTVSQVFAPAHGTAVANADGTVTYTPAPGFTGVDSFLYRVSDGRSGQDKATVTVSVTCPKTLLFSDDLEPGAEPGWTVETAANDIPASSPWTVRADPAAHSPQNVWFSDGSATAINKDDRLISPPLDLSPLSRLVFWHHFDLETNFDGGVLEISTDGGQTWTNLEAQIVAGGYTGRIPSEEPEGERAWTGSSGGPGMVRVEVDLGPWAGPGRRIRWRLVCDIITAEIRTGWLVDDVEVSDFPLACPGS